MKKRRLRPYVIPSLTTLTLVTFFALALFMDTSGTIPNPTNYVSDIILGNDLMVIDEKEVIINPYTSQDVEISKNFYDYKSEAAEQEKSISQYDDTYIQNTGVDFTSANEFDCIAILKGEVIDVTADESLGNIVKVKHENDYVSIYQSLSEVSVKKGDKVEQGQVLGKSGKNKLDEDLGNHLHFELYVNGQMVNPLNFLNKNLDKSSKEE